MSQHKPMISMECIHGNVRFLKSENDIIYCEPILDQVYKESLIDDWHTMFGKIEAEAGQHITLDIDWPTSCPGDAEEQFKKWNIAGWHPHNLVCFADRFFFISTDQLTWEKLTNITVKNNHIIIELDMPADVAYISATYQYTYSMLTQLIRDVESSPYVKILELCRGDDGEPMRLFRITDASVDNTEKKHVFMEAGVHCTETIGSHVIDSMIRYLCEGGRDACELLKKTVYHLIPVVDVSAWRQGIQAGSCKNKLKNMNRDFGTFCSDETRSIDAYINAIRCGKDSIFLCDMHGGWPGTTDNPDTVASWFSICSDLPTESLCLTDKIFDALTDPRCSFIQRTHGVRVNMQDMGATTMHGYFCRLGYNAFNIEMSYTTVYDSVVNALIPISKNPLWYAGRHLPQAFEKVFKK